MHLFKFSDSVTALHILEARQLRWSAPECFGDAMELSSQSPLGFEVPGLLDSTIKLASSMIFAPEKPRGDSPLINAINRWRDEERFSSPAEAHPVLRDLLLKMVDYRSAQLKSNLSKWQSFVRNARLCCFCEHADTPEAWDLYADQHRGVALRFDTSDSLWGDVRPVTYQAERPQVTTLREQLGAILHNRPDAMVSRFWQNFLTKPTHRSPEKEWRSCRIASQEVAITDHHSADWREHMHFPVASLSAVYFGLHTSDEYKHLLAAQVHQLYPQARLLQTQFNKATYALEFHKVV